MCSRYTKQTHTHTNNYAQRQTSKLFSVFWQLSNFGVVQFPKFIIDRRCKTVCCTVRTQISQSVKCTHAQGQILTSVNALLVLRASWRLSVLSHSAQTLFSQLKWNANLLKLHSFIIIIVHVQVHNPTPTHIQKNVYFYVNCLLFRRTVQFLMS